eukprot:CAMPEP_0195036328 /NCGR_PEP_ID=MMETSP0326_2-20130528/72270_1 /TAXON_ID=2866 ORGANISM="Crypthecodinium cohnii, Strain Seligo" /NCGR_SAMPLE_ID=MMETSP0326_2 /ASSEMBLY_ACC=CAM_ASM_000348 /LENGTH=45 /DNA_ID= /DNA_START= /DNA_END= /DNA_ORIENTATION=
MDDVISAAPRLLGRQACISTEDEAEWQMTFRHRDGSGGRGDDARQ